MKHIHHIIPKHMGGTDSIDNLIELTVEEHAEAHKILYEQYGKEEDYIAWRGLSSSIGREEMFFKKSRLGGKKNKGKPKTSEHRKKISENAGGGVIEHSVETKKIISKKMLGNKNSSNHHTSEYKKKQSEAMKIAWQRRKNNNSV